MEWTSIVTHFHYWILGKNVDLSGSPSGCARQTPLVVVAFGVLSVWWKTSASVSTLFWVVLPQLVLEPIMVMSSSLFYKTKSLTNKSCEK